MEITWPASFCYLFSAIFFWTHLWLPRRRLSGIGYGLLLLGVLVQTGTLTALYIKGRPLPRGIESTLFLLSWFVAAVYVIFDTRLRLTVLGAFVAPLALVLTLPSAIIPESVAVATPTLENPWLLAHVVLVLLGGAVFAVAFIAGALYLFEEKSLKSKHIGSFIKKFPSLTKLDSLNHACLLIGFPLLSLGLAVGVISAKQIWGVFWRWDYKEILTLVTWFIFAALIHGRLAFGWKGKKAALGAILGFFAIILSLLVSSYFAPGEYGGGGVY